MLLHMCILLDNLDVLEMTWQPLEQLVIGTAMDVASQKVLPTWIELVISNRACVRPPNKLRKVVEVRALGTSTPPTSETFAQIPGVIVKPLLNSVQHVLKV